MRRRDRLTRRERRDFDALVKSFFEHEAADPQAPPSNAPTPVRRRIDPRHPSARQEPED
jgi:hypothetical protein